MAEVDPEQIYLYITANEYPEDSSEGRKRAIRKKAKKFMVRDGELYYKQGETKHKVRLYVKSTILNH